MPKIFMIALDGATLDLLQPWMNEGELPLLKGLFESGSVGVLNSTIPWATPTAFSSFSTGCNPGQHGVTDFGRLIGEGYTGFVPTNGSDVARPTLWKLLTDAGMSSLVVNMPMTYPAVPLNGRLIAGIPYPSGSKRLCHPAELLDDLRSSGWDLAQNASDDLGGSYDAYYDGLLRLIENRGAATAHMIREQDPDLVCVHFLETDQVQHRFWQFLPGEPKYDPNGPFTDGILRLYQKVEEAMAVMLDTAGEETLICIMSDHGFGPMRRQTWPNNWLLQNGYLTLKSGFGVAFKRWLYRIGITPAGIREAAPERLKLAILKFFERQKGRALASQLEEEDESVARKGIIDRLIERIAIDFYDLDWAKTKAFSTGSTGAGFIFINLVGRDPQGIVQPGDEYEALRTQLIEDLSTWDCVGEVKRKEEIWSGEKLGQAPDLIVLWKDGSIDARYFQTRFSSPHLSKPVPNDYASHRLEGLVAFAGPGVISGTPIQADIIDLAPTFLWLLGRPVPEHMDGRVLTDLFDIDRPVTTEKIDLQIENEFGMTDEDEAEILESLKNLGYIE